MLFSRLLLYMAAAALGSSNGASSTQAFTGPINVVVLDKKSIVIIVPTNEGDKGAQKRIHARARSIRDRFFSPETLVITDKQALGRDLSPNSLLLYGTPSGNIWLAKHVSGLPARIEPHQIVTDQPIAGTDLRFITAWPNPFNPAKGMVICTAQSAKDLSVDIFHGSEDYVVARGTEVLRSGNYIKQKNGWRFAHGGHLPSTAAIADLDFFFRTVEEVHPQPLAFVSPEDYLSLKRQSKTRLEQAADKEGNVPKHLPALVLAEAAAFFKDGHTNCYLSPSLLDTEDPTKRMLPFRLEYRRGDILISDTTGEFESLTGHKLLNINGVSFVEFIGPILDKLSGERTAFKISGFMDKQRVYWAMVPLTTEPEVSITVLDDKGESASLTVGLLSLHEYDVGVPTKHRAKAQGYHEFHHGGKTCYWRYNSFVYSEVEKRSVDSLFALLMEKQVDNLIIDLRFNGGGNSRAGGYILDYLTAKPYRQFSRVDVKLSDQVFETGRQTRLKELAGLTATWRAAPRRPEDNDRRFDGRLFLLTGPDTFSSAAHFAATVKDYRIGTLIGEETGGLRQSFGDQVRFRAPNSGISFGVSYKRFYAPIPKPGDDLHLRGTVPDVILDKNMLARYLDSDDPVKSFALDYVGAK